MRSTTNQITVYPTLANWMTAVSRSGYIRRLHSGPPSIHSFIAETSPAQREDELSSQTIKEPRALE